MRGLEGVGGLDDRGSFGLVKSDRGLRLELSGRGLDLSDEVCRLGLGLELSGSRYDCDCRGMEVIAFAKNSERNSKIRSISPQTTES